MCLGFVSCGFLVWCLRFSVGWALIVLVFFVCFTCVLFEFVGCVVGFAVCLWLLFRFGLAVCWLGFIYCWLAVGLCLVVLVGLRLVDVV